MGTVRLRPEPVSDAGRRAWELADELARSWEPTAGDRDRAGVFDPAEVTAVQRSGLAGCCVPAELGGLGVDRLQDLMAVVHRLAEADGSLALVVHMHVSGTWSLSRARRAQLSGSAGATDADHDAGGLTTLLRDVAGGTTWLCAAVTEAGTNFFHPRTTLAPAPGGWVLDGTKVFATGSPAATHFSANARVDGGAHDGRLAQVIVPVTTAGVHVADDWDGLGMRASGSGVVRFERVALDPATIVLPGGPYGRFTTGSLCGRAFGNVGNVTAMAGLAATARQHARRRASTGRRVDDAPLGARATVRQALGELEADAVLLLAAVEHLGRRADAMADRMLDAPTAVDEADARGFMAEFQASKLQINRLAVAVVDRALALAGGSGYAGSDPLARLVRDVRAGQFMQPFSPHEALGFLGSVAAGVDPDPLA